MISGHLTTDLSTISTMMYDLTGRLNTVRHDSEIVYDASSQIAHEQHAQQLHLAEDLSRLREKYDNEFPEYYTSDGETEIESGTETETETETEAELKATQREQQRQKQKQLLAKLEAENLDLTLKLQRCQEAQQRLTTTVSHFESALESIVNRTRRREAAHHRVLTKLDHSYEMREDTERIAHDQLRGDRDVLRQHLAVVDKIGNRAVDQLSKALAN